MTPDQIQIEATAIARKSLVIGGRFLTALEIADSMGFASESADWDCAVRAVRGEFNRYRICTNRKSRITKIETYRG